jgi:hypothetical protein
MTGTASRNTAPHHRASRSRPPRTGPSSMPPMKQLIQTEMAVPCCLGSWNMVLISARVEGISVAPASPMRARLTMSISGLTENAASVEAAANATPPTSSRRRLPMRSPSVPIVTRKLAMTKP